MPPMPAPRSAPRRTGLRPTSVPAILLSLGALCLLVAAVIFLAVAWSWLGVGGRTGVLAGLTVTGAGLGGWLTARGLRVAGEALSTVTFGLLTLDLVGADRAGWLGERTSSELALILGLSLLSVALAWSVAQARLAAPQLVAGIGLFTAYAATVDLLGHQLLISAVAVVAFAALAAVGRANGLAVLPWVALAGAAPCWLTLAGAGLGESLERADPLRSLGCRRTRLGPARRDRAAPAADRRARGDDQGVALVCLAAAASMGVATVCLPVVDEGLTAVIVTALAVMVAGVAAGVGTSRDWLAVPLLPAGFAALPVLATWLTMLAQGVAHVLDVGAPFTARRGRAAGAVRGARPPGPDRAVGAGAARPGLAHLPAVVSRTCSCCRPVPWSRCPRWPPSPTTPCRSGRSSWRCSRIAALAATRDLALGAVLVAAALIAGLPSASLTVLTTAVVVVACAATLRRPGWQGWSCRSRSAACSGRSARSPRSTSPSAACRSRSRSACSPSCSTARRSRRPRRPRRSSPAPQRSRRPPTRPPRSRCT